MNAYDRSHVVRAERGESIAPVLRRGARILLAGALVGTGVGAGLTLAMPTPHVATSAVLVTPIGTHPLAPGPRDDQLVNLDTEAQLLRSTAVAALAAKSAPVSAGWLREHSSVQVVPNARVLRISVAGKDAGRTLRASAALADAYLRYRATIAEDATATRLARAERQLAAVQARVRTLAVQVAKYRDGTAARVVVNSELRVANAQLNRLQAEVTRLTTTPVEPGRVVEPAQLTNRNSGGALARNSLIGLAIGLLLGLAGAFGRDRTDRRVRSAADLALPVLGQLPAPSDAQALLRSTPLPGVRTVQAAVRAADPAPRLLLVPASCAGDLPTPFAAQLATALAASGESVVLVSARSGAPDIAKLLKVASRPGLSEALNGSPTDAIVGDVVQRAPSGLHMVAMGSGDVTAAVFDARLPELLAALSDRYDRVIVDAPAADDMSIAPLALATDAAVLPVSLGTTRWDALAAAASTVSAAGCQVLGAVVIDPALPTPAPAPLPVPASRADGTESTASRDMLAARRAAGKR